MSAVSKVDRINELAGEIRFLSVEFAGTVIESSWPLLKEIIEAGRQAVIAKRQAELQALLESCQALPKERG